MDKFEAFEKYEAYQFYDNSRKARRNRPGPKKKKNRRTQQKVRQIQKELRTMDDGIENWVPSYAKALDPRHHERQWVIESVGHFYREQIISDVTRLVKGGKEANVYACVADSATGLELIAAKLYRPRELRHLKNDAVYKAGRQLRDAEGKQIKGRRVKLALNKKTSYGKSVDIQWWIGNEYRTQTQLYLAGANVPKPIGHQGNTILMEYIGDEYGPAPTLSEVRLPAEEAEPLFRRIMENVWLMLDNHLIHGDLSAYNILYWEGAIYLIDFPQMVEARHNPHAYELLERDITRVCDYFAGYGVKRDPRQLTRDLWEPYMGPGD
ncbi:RIO1 family regulatory kinase/ATPase [Candidatus Leptofilum sp.]|uniref:RIO1 family regulatory kinase/ATPase domain-containing protein n=1 Tax=Candidatus Leptofilum sp. TaxID=3241576 RepID=UPI003B5B19F5